MYPSKYRLTVSVLALLGTIGSSVHAETSEEGSLEEIIIIGQADKYAARNSITATKTDTPLSDIPQTIQVITRDQLDDQAHRSLSDVLRFVPGITIGQGEGNRDQITVRGQNTTADFFLDGVRDDVQYYRGLYNIERVEVLKGPYALIFGRGGGGGIINRVQKTPQTEKTFLEARLSGNSFGAWDVSGDYNLSLSDKTALRLNAVYESLSNHRDYFGGERYAINPYLASRLNEAWTLGASYEYVNDKRVTDRGVPSLNSKPIKGYSKQFFGVPGVNDTTIKAHITKLRLDGDLASNLKLTTTVLYGQYVKNYRNVYANAPATSQTGTVALDAYSDPTWRNNLLVQSNLIWNLTSGDIEHTLLFGLEAGLQNTKNKRFNRTFSPTNIFSLTNPVFPAVTYTTPTRNTKSNVSVMSAYVQDQIKLNDQFIVVAGLRYDRFKIEGTDFIPNPTRDFERKDEKISPRLGIIYKPLETISLYASQSRSFLPRSGDQFATLSITQQNLAPERFKNNEIGAKWQIGSGFNLNASLYELIRSNATTPNPSNPLSTINIGETKTSGFEIEVVGQVNKNWLISGGYTHQNAVLRGNKAVKLAQVPEHQLALWNRYNLSRKLGFGLGVVYQSSQYAAIKTSNVTTQLPGFTRWDGGAYYQLNEDTELQLNIENLFDVAYFSDAHNNNNVTPGAPINVRLTLNRKF
jgi:catecholate siderophore receptor